MLKELSLSEIRDYKKYVAEDTELYELLEEYAKNIEENKKVIVKEKTSNTGISVVFYDYDKKLYRYVKTGEFYL